MRIDFDLIVRLCGVFLVVVFIIGMLYLCGVFGCNVERIAQETKAIFDVDTEIELLEQGIVRDKSKLKMVPLTDLSRLEIERRVEENTQKLKLLHSKKGRMVSQRDQKQAEDDQVFTDLTSVARDITPFGYGSAVVALMSLFRNVFKSRAVRNLVLTGQEIYKNVSDEDKARLENVRSNAANRLVKNVKDNALMSRI